MAGVKVIGVGKHTKLFMLAKSSGRRLSKIPGSLWESTFDVGREDPRRVIHAIKMGVALTLVSLLYLLEPLFEGIGSNAMWAVITVVVVLEFTTGATLYKGLNRGLGTLIAGTMAILIVFVAEKTSMISRAIFIGTSVFVVGFVATFLRFFPYIKRNYDYGVLIFLVTFNLITVSSYRVQNILDMARDRLYTISIGCFICLCMSLLILPNWSGEDLHNSTVNKLETLAKSVEACVNDYFQDEKTRHVDEGSSRYPIYKGYRSVLDSKSSDETLALYASWEPRHSRHCYPWQQYVKLGTVLRHFAYTVVALHGYLESEIQAPQSLRSQFREPCIQLGGEVCKVLMELASSIKNHQCCPPNVLSDHLHEALKDLNLAIRSQPCLFLGSNHVPPPTTISSTPSNVKPENDAPSGTTVQSTKTDMPALQTLRSRKFDEQPKVSVEWRILRPSLSRIAILDFAEALPLAAFASSLVEMVARLELVIEEVEGLGRAAHFKINSGEDENKHTRIVQEKVVTQVVE